LAKLDKEDVHSDDEELGLPPVNRPKALPEKSRKPKKRRN
jgi:hypothetical protein